jgi:diketogulonate reductase-like aldo/keto reductase
VPVRYAFSLVNIDSKNSIFTKRQSGQGYEGSDTRLPARSGSSLNCVSMNNHTVTFSNGQQVLALGQGTYMMGRSWLKRRQEIKALRAGIDLGMTAIDTAERYKNERLVGQAIRGLRDKVFLVTKVQPFNAKHSNDVIAACERSLSKLGTDFIDLYLLHWTGSLSSYDETVAAMTLLCEQGKVRMWGVSNMDVPKMERFFSIINGDACAANQVRYHVAARDIERDLIPWCKEYCIVVMAYSPMGEGKLVQDPTLSAIGRKYNPTAAQVALAWSVRNTNILSIPKASSPSHVLENFKSLSIPLTEEDISEIDRVYPPPAGNIPAAT